MRLWTIVALLAAAYCIARAIWDLRQRQYVWAGLGFLCAAAILFTPIQTHAVKVDLPVVGANRQPLVNRVIFPASIAPEMLKQCSRDAPTMEGSGWQPTDANVDAMEVVLPKALAGLPQAREVDFSGLLEKWQRQYVGLTRGGRRFIYGNYFPVDGTNELAEWRKQPMMVCDGGARFFGAEFDVAAKRITHIDFNGSVGG